MKRAAAATTGLATVALALWLAMAHRAPSPPPFVLLAVLDTTRPDHLSIYGAERPTAPTLAALASGGVVFERALATAPWTVPSHASLFTGRMPGDLNVGWHQRNLPADMPVLAEAFGAAGFRTIGISENRMLGTTTGFPRGFETWRPVEVGQAPAALESALAEKTDDQPLFVFVNLIAPHLPYSPPPLQWREIVRVDSPRARQLAGSVGGACCACARMASSPRPTSSCCARSTTARSEPRMRSSPTSSPHCTRRVPASASRSSPPITARTSAITGSSITSSVCRTHCCTCRWSSPRPGAFCRAAWRRPCRSAT